MIKLKGNNEVPEDAVLLYDGQESIEITIDKLMGLNANFSKTNESGYFEGLWSKISEIDFHRLVIECSLSIIPVFESYKDKNGLSVYYKLGEIDSAQKLIVYSYGEFQAGRYKYYLLGKYTIE